MNREIKFRAWDKEEKEMIHNVERTYDFTCSGYGVYEPSFGDVLQNTDRYEVMQFTGLKDINGKEIYEGDILKENNGDLDICIYLDTVASYGFVPIEIYLYYKEDNREIENSFALVEDMFRSYDTQCFPRNLEPNIFLEVIGNIFENPKLLKEEE